MNGPTVSSDWFEAVGEYRVAVKNPKYLIRLGSELGLVQRHRNFAYRRQLGFGLQENY